MPSGHGNMRELEIVNLVEQGDQYFVCVMVRPWGVDDGLWETQQDLSTEKIKEATILVEIPNPSKPKYFKSCYGDNLKKSRRLREVLMINSISCLWLPDEYHLSFTEIFYTFNASHFICFVFFVLPYKHHMLILPEVSFFFINTAL